MKSASIFRSPLTATVVLVACCMHSVGIAQQRAQLPPPGTPIVGTLTSQQTDPHQLVLTAGPRLSVAMQPLLPSQAQYWTLASVGRNTVRLQLFQSGSLWSLVVEPASGRVGFERSAEKFEQLWRVTPSQAVAGALRFESIALPGNFLAGDANSAVSLQSFSGSPSQSWYFDAAPPPAAIQVPIQRLIAQSIDPNPPLPPVPTRLVNSNRNELLVRVTDLRTANATDISIPSGGFRDITLDRDAGATFTERYEVIGPFGVIFSQQLTTPVPPASFYDVSVYEKFLQSIAIDRTGKSPNPIEDINYQPKSIGFFIIPAGEQFRGGNLDVFAQARQSNNPGGVRRIDPNTFNNPKPRLDPLEQTLKELQRK